VETDLEYVCDDSRHLVCVPFSIENLHRMARELNICKCWYHNSSNHPHYDIPKRRIAEITARCRVVTSFDLLAICRIVDAIQPPAKVTGDR
jgi:Protein of unknown function (DUF4031)